MAKWQINRIDLAAVANDRQVMVVEADRVEFLGMWVLFYNGLPVKQTLVKAVLLAPYIEVVEQK